MQLADSADNEGFHDVRLLVNLDGAFLGKLADTVEELFPFHAAFRRKTGKQFRREYGEVDKGDRGFFFTYRIAHAEFSRIEDSDDISGIGFFYSLPLCGEKLLRLRKSEHFAALPMEYGSALFKNTGTDTQESNTVMVFGIHVCLDFENESGESRIFRRNVSFQRFSFFRRRSKFQIFFKKSLYAEVCHGGTEKEGGQFAFGYFVFIKRVACFFQKLQVIFEGTENLFGEMGNDFRIVYPA